MFFEKVPIGVGVRAALWKNTSFNLKKGVALTELF